MRLPVSAEDFNDVVERLMLPGVEQDGQNMLGNWKMPMNAPLSRQKTMLIRWKTSQLEQLAAQPEGELKEALEIARMQNSTHRLRVAGSCPATEEGGQYRLCRVLECQMIQVVIYSQKNSSVIIHTFHLKIQMTTKESPNDNGNLNYDENPNDNENINGTHTLHPHILVGDTPPICTSSPSYIHAPGAGKIVLTDTGKRIHL